MCGITGFFSYKNKCDTNKFYEAHRKIAHRGPDDEGFIYKNKNNILEHLIGYDSMEKLKALEHILNKEPSSLILGHRRLSILDLTECGHQPYAFENFYLVYNGEIFNYIELRNELKEIGYSFDTDGDTEVFLKAYHCWGIEAFNKYNGMWAAAIYDVNTDSIILTRDRFGVKPLYYSLVNDSLIFASEIKFISSFFDILEVNEQMAYDYIEYGYVSHTKHTFFKNISQLQPGFYAIYNCDKFFENRYYSAKENRVDNKIHSVKSILSDSIKLRMRSDVKIGSLLSGGIDSSSIVCLICDQKLSNKFDTFTISYPEKDLDYERQYVDDVMDKTKYSNYSIELKQEIDLVDELVRIIESPYRTFSENSAYYIYKHINNNTNIKVLLNGEGADELFSGYTVHYFYYLVTLLLGGKLPDFYKEYSFIKKRIGCSNAFLMKETIIALLKTFNLAKYFKKHTFYNKKFKIYNIKYSKNPLKNEILSNRFFSALPEYLKYADKISMNFSLEVRVPFLDYRLVDISNSFEDNDYIRNGITKYTLREAMKYFIPRSVYERKDKKGFFTPHELWLKTIFTNAIEKEIKEIRNNGMFDFINTKGIYDYYKKHGANQKIWRVYCLSRWRKVWGIKY